MGLHHLPYLAASAAFFVVAMASLAHAQIAPSNGVAPGSDAQFSSGVFGAGSSKGAGTVNVQNGVYASTFNILDTSAAHYVNLGATSSSALTADRALTIDVVNAARTLKLGSNLTIASDPGAVTGALKSNGTGSFAQAGASDLANGTTGSGAAVLGTSPTITTPNIVGTVTNDNATAGSVGEYIYSVSNGQTATVTITIASPAVISWTGHGLQAGTAVEFSTTGALPTGITTATTYYVIPAGLTANAFEISTSPFGSAVNTSGTQSGTQTSTAQSVAAASGAAWNLGAISLTAGDWEVCGGGNIASGSTSNTAWFVAANATSATLPTLSPILGSGTGPLANFKSAAAALNQQLNLSCARASLAGTTTIYLIGEAVYTGSANLANTGWISGRRVR